MGGSSLRDDLVGLTKRAALEAVAAAGPVAVLFGAVESVSPLSIRVEQRLVLSETQLVLSRCVTDSYSALNAGELVILLRVQGGQRYVVLDRLGGSPDVTGGQWVT
jgi:hypothetical protein